MKRISAISGTSLKDLRRKAEQPNLVPAQDAVAPVLASSSFAPVIFSPRKLSEDVCYPENNDVIVFSSSKIKDSSTPLNVLTKMPTIFLQKLLLWSTSSGAMLSVSLDTLQVMLNPEFEIYAALSNRLNPIPLNKLQVGVSSKALAQSVKPGDMTSEITPRGNIVYGNIPYSDKYVDARNQNYSSYERDGISISRGYNLIDNLMVSKFPDGSRDISSKAAEDIKAAFEGGTYIRDVKVIGRFDNKSCEVICFSEKLPKFRRAAHESNNLLDVIKFNDAVQFNLVHFIQRTESLHSILKNIARGFYVKVKFINNELTFQDANYNDVEFSINLQHCPIHIQKNLELFVNKLIVELNSNSDNQIFLDELNNTIANLLKVETSEDYVFPLWERTDKLKRPLMVLAGEDGYAVVDDITMLQVPGSFELPAWVSETFATSYLTAEEIKNRLAVSVAKMRVPRPDGTYSSGLAKIFKDNIEPAYRHYISCSNAQLIAIGATNIYELVINYYFNEVLKPSNVQGSKMWRSASNAGNPKYKNIDTPFSVFGDKFYYTGTGEHYLHFLLHDRAILEKNPLLINASWLSDDAPYREIWKDIIKIQALHCLRLPDIDLKSAVNNYFECLQNNIKLPRGLEEDTMLVARQSAKDIVTSIHLEINEHIKQGLSNNDIEKLVTSIYNRYADGIDIINKAVKNVSVIKKEERGHVGPTNII